MALVEFVRSARESRLFPSKASREARDMPQQNSEVQINPIFSEAFLQQRERQEELDNRLAELHPTGPFEHVGIGQDRVVQLMPTNEGDYVLKTFIPTSRANLVFGLGVPASEVPPDTDSGARARLVATRSSSASDPFEVAEKVRLMQVMASTYLGEENIWPTATVVNEGKVQHIQRFIPRFSPPPSAEKDPFEIKIETEEKVKLFNSMQERWRQMLTTPDFKQLPNDVQDYWRTFPPDAGFGTNAVFLGVGNVVAIDF